MGLADPFIFPELTVNGEGRRTGELSRNLLETIYFPYKSEITSYFTHLRVPIHISGVLITRRFIFWNESVPHFPMVDLSSLWRVDF